MPEEQKSSLMLAAQSRLLNELHAANERSARFGLTLSAQSMVELSKARVVALRDHGRIELDGSAITLIIEGFCDSPFLQQEDYEATLLELTDAFYYFKNACGDQLTDDELIEAMRERYDAYDGSVDAVTGTTLEALCRARRFGFEEEMPWEEEDGNENE